ncbi:MAG: DUF4397 domain-containing protein, partial [Rubrivirga sp.]
MRYFATLALAAVLLSPLSQAQQAIAPQSVSNSIGVPALVAPGDTTVVSNIPEGTNTISTFTGGEGNFLFGTGSFGTEIFGSGYTLPDEAPYEVIGSTLFVTGVPDDGETFTVSVYEGTLEDGPDSTALYTESFDTDLVPDVADNTISQTVIFFDQPVPVSGDVFFVVYDVNGVTSQFGAGSTALLDNETPETIVTQDGVFVRVDQEFNAGSDPLQVYLFGDAIVVEVEEDAGVARLQVIHNAPDPAASTVDVYVNGALTLDDVDFREASPFLDVPGGEDLVVDVVPGDAADNSAPVF